MAVWRAGRIFEEKLLERRIVTAANGSAGSIGWAKRCGFTGAAAQRRRCTCAASRSRLTRHPKSKPNPKSKLGKLSNGARARESRLVTRRAALPMRLQNGVGERTPFWLSGSADRGRDGIVAGCPPPFSRGEAQRRSVRGQLERTACSRSLTPPSCRSLAKPREREPCRIESAQRLLHTPAATQHSSALSLSRSIRTGPLLILCGWLRIIG